MASLSTGLLRRAITVALLALVALAFAPGLASAHPKAVVRLLGTDPAYTSTTLTMPDGTRFTATPGLFRLRITPEGGAPVERRGFCVDALHPFPVNRDFNIYLSTSVYDALLATPRYGEAAWLIQQAQALVAAAAPAKRALEAGALQTAVWQLTDQAREVNPSTDAALNARTAELRALAAGRAVGGPVTLAPVTARGCAGRGTVTLTLTGTPGGSATLAVTGGSGTVSPSEVRFAADGTATSAVSSATPGTVGITVRSEGGTLTRLARTNPGAVRPQESMVLVPKSYSATTSVVFEDCPVIPFEEGPSTNPPTTPTTPTSPLGPLETPSAKPPTPTRPPTGTNPRTPAQTGPRFRVVKTGPARILAGERARYTITVINRGTTVLRNLRLSDDLPPGLSLTGTPAGSRLRGGSLVWSLTPLKVGARRTFHVGVRVDADISGRRCNTATVGAPGLRSRTASACTVVLALSRSLLPAVTA
jgi:uncharacterized repeat protein (TIGR01451 family)